MCIFWPGEQSLYQRNRDLAPIGVCLIAKRRDDSLRRQCKFFADFCHGPIRDLVRGDRIIDRLTIKLILFQHYSRQQTFTRQSDFRHIRNTIKKAASGYFTTLGSAHRIGSFEPIKIKPIDRDERRWISSRACLQHGQAQIGPSAFNRIIGIERI